MKRLAPVWLLGAGFLPVGLFGAVMLLVVPQLLAARRVPEHSIAFLTAIALSASLLAMPFLPLLDWRLRRRTYAIILVSLVAGCILGALLCLDDLTLLAGFMFAGNLALSFLVAAIGGWFGDLVPAERKDALGAWFNAYNVGAGGGGAVIAVFLLRALGIPAGAVVIAAAVLTVIPLYLMTPCPPASRKLAGEGFRDFVADIAQLFRRRDVSRILLIFIAPCASFALTSTFGGLGREFGASANLVGVTCGLGAALAGIVGGLLVPRLTRHIAPVPLYLLVGGIGAMFTLALASAPHGAATFVIAVLGEYLFQAVAFTTAAAITLRMIGHDNPLAATQFGVLIGITQIPTVYMLVIDGHAYKWAGPSGGFVADALISAAACAIFATLLFGYRRRMALR